jgi:hypothetical protein
VSAFLCVCVVLCVGRSLGAGLIPHPRSPTKCLTGSIIKKKKKQKTKKKKNKRKENLMPEKGIRNNEKEEERDSCHMQVGTQISE